MKIGKYLMVAAASVMMFGCAKDDATSGIDGKVALSLKLVSPMSKAITDGTVDGTNSIEVSYTTFDVLVEGSSVAYEGGTASGDGWQQYAKDAEAIVLVENPSAVKVRINGGKDTYNITDLASMQTTAPTGIAAYGSTTDFTVRSAAHNGVYTTAGGDSYDLYDATVNLKIPVARLEISGLQHDDEGEDCEYSALSLKNYTVKKLPESVTYSETNGYAATTGTSEVVDETATADNFKTGVYPSESGKVYASYILPTENPMLQFVMQGTIDGVFTDRPRYATVKTFQVSGEDPVAAEDFSFEAGKIYRIKEVKISDQDINSSEEGDEQIALNIIVEVADWSVVDVTVDF